MGEHKTKKSKMVIEALECLGYSLSYDVKKEYPMQKNKLGAQSIDVAWFIDEQSDYPIMIFEIESKANNSVYNNPGKVFGKANKDFEKPLFFFHIFIECGVDTEKINDLEGNFGKNNYRIYRLSDGDLNQLIIDILSQHRRICYNFNIYHLLLSLSDKSFFGANVNFDVIINFIEDKINSSEEKILLPTYALLSQNNKYFKEKIVKVLQCRNDNGRISSNEDKFSTYIGDNWSYPLYLGILSYVSKETSEKEYYFDLFKKWQEHNHPGYLMIGPYFGLSKDYDDFILGYAGAFLTLISCLMKETKSAVNYIVAQGIEILKKLEGSEFIYSYYTSLWLLHISSSCYECKEHYDYIKEYINRFGGINKELIYNPPSIVSEEFDVDAQETIEDNKEFIVEFDEFNINIVKIINENVVIDKDILDFTIDLLISDKTIYFSSRYLLHYLRHN